MSVSSEKFSYSSGSDDDDDAPGEVSLSAAKNTKLSQVRDDRQRDKEAKDRVREKRRTRNEMFTAQKKQKMESFGERALPEDVLQAVSSKGSKFDEELEEAFGDVNDDEDGSDGEGGSGGDSDGDDDEDNSDSDDSDFIALDSNAKKNALNVVTVEEPKKNMSSLDKALAFRNEKLYSGPNAPNRCSAAMRKGLMQKKKIMQMK